MVPGSAVLVQLRHLWSQLRHLWARHRQAPGRPSGRSVTVRYPPCAPGQRARDGQTQTDSTGGPRPRRVEPGEPLEHALPVRRCDPRAVVHEPERRRPRDRRGPRVPGHRHPNRTEPNRTESGRTGRPDRLPGVVGQVGQDLRQPEGVGTHDETVRGGHPDVEAGCEGTGPVQLLTGERDEVDVGGVQLHPTVEPGDVQQGLDEAGGASGPGRSRVPLSLSASGRSATAGRCRHWRRSRPAGCAQGRVDVNGTSLDATRVDVVTNAPTGGPGHGGPMGDRAGGPGGDGVTVGRTGHLDGVLSGRPAAGPPAAGRCLLSPSLLSGCRRRWRPPARASG